MKKQKAQLTDPDPVVFFSAKGASNATGCTVCSMPGCDGKCGGGGRVSGGGGGSVLVDLTGPGDEVQIKSEPEEEVARPRMVVRYRTPATWTEPSVEDAADGYTMHRSINVVPKYSVEYDKVEAELRADIDKGSTRFMYTEFNPHPTGETWPAAYILKEYKQLPQNFTIEKMERVQNQTSTLCYAVIKNGMIEMAGLEHLKEETVYHGTNPELARKICLEGFNRSFTKIHRFGVGCYADRYGQSARSHAGPAGCIIVATAVSTKIGKTKNDSKEPPPGADIGGSGDDYKTEFRISFKDNQLLARYILHVKTVPRSRW